MKDYRPLVSSAPAHSILNAQAFRYTSSVETDIRKTFARIARSAAIARAALVDTSNVQALAKKRADNCPKQGSPQPLRSLA